MTAKTRFGLEGYGVRRVGSFSGKTPSVVVTPPTTTTSPADKDYTPLIDAQLAGATVRCAYLVFLDFKSGPVRLWPGFGDLTIGGYTYRGIGNLGALSTITAGPGGAVDEITATLFGDSTILANLEADAAESAGQNLEVLLAFFDIRQTDEMGNWVDWAPFPDPLSLFVGRMGPMTVKRQPPDLERGGATRIISVPAQSILVNRARPSFQFFSDRDQKSRSPTDNIFLRVSQMSEGSVRWPVF